MDQKKYFKTYDLVDSYWLFLDLSNTACRPRIYVYT
jgi:hypothetical protein